MPANSGLTRIQSKACWVEKMYSSVVTWRRPIVSNSSSELSSLSIRWLIQRCRAGFQRRHAVNESIHIHEPAEPALRPDVDPEPLPGHVPLSREDARRSAKNIARWNSYL